jgi:hypothetical protein
MSDASEIVIDRAQKRHETTRDAEKRKPVTDERGPTEEQLAAKFRLQMYNNALPELSEIPGYHLCWLSTTNKYDSIASREAMGYERVKPEEMPGMDHITVKTGMFAGCIGHEEMVLFKLPMSLWQQYMTIAHHERPWDEEERIRDVARYVKDIAQDGGGDVYLGDGTREILNSRKPRNPTFSE